MFQSGATFVACITTALAAPAKDLVAQLPDFPPAPFKVYSGYITVPDYGGPYDTLKIHFERCWGEVWELGNQILRRSSQRGCDAHKHNCNPLQHVANAKQRRPAWK